MDKPKIAPTVLIYSPEHFPFQRQTDNNACVSYAFAHCVMLQKKIFNNEDIYIDALKLREKQIRFLGKPINFKGSISYKEGAELLIHKGYNGIYSKPLGTITIPDLKRWILKGYFPLLTYNTHAIVAVGYDDVKECITVMDSQAKYIYKTISYEDLPKLQDKPYILFIKKNANS